MIKKLLSVLLSLLLVIGMISGCSNKQKGEPEQSEGESRDSASTDQNTDGTKDEELPGNTQSSAETSAPTTEHSQTEETSQTVPAVNFYREQVILVSEGETFRLYDGVLDAAMVWGSENEAVAVFSDGVITAVSAGETVVYCEYNGTRVECLVTCNIETAPTTQDPVDVSNPRAPVKAAPTAAVVDASFFDDAAFVGDSISLKLSNYAEETGALGDATFLVRGSYGVGNEVEAGYHIIFRGQEMVIEEALTQAGVSKVFIMLGMNDIGLYGIDATIENWGEMIENIRSKCPDMDIYIQSMTPVWTGGEVGSLNNANVDTYNDRLEEFAAANGCVYIDVASYLKDSTGGLATAFCSDEYVHLTDEGASTWIKVLKAFTGY